MGVKLRPILEEYNCIEETEIEGLRFIKVAIDAYNALYQFLAVIRQEDGKPLMDSRGKSGASMNLLSTTITSFLAL